MPTLLITGGTGLLGGSLLRLAAAANTWETCATYLSQAPPPGAVRFFPLDVRQPAAVSALFAQACPDVVIHTAYDRRGDFDAVNHRGTAHVADAARAGGAHLIFLSTDAVFDGNQGRYREDDPPRPFNAYGQSKAAAEPLVLESGGLVVRTSLLYRLHPPDPNTQRLVLDPLDRGETPRLFADEYRSPSFVDDLAAALLEAAERRLAGLLHVAGPERLNRHEYGQRLAAYHGYDPARIPPNSLAQSGLVRGADTSLDCRRARALLKHFPRPLGEVLATG